MGTTSSSNPPPLEVARPASNLSMRQEDETPAIDESSKLTVPSLNSKSSNSGSADSTTTRPPSESADRPMSATSERRYTSLEAKQGASDTSMNKSDGDSGIEGTPKPECKNES